MILLVVGTIMMFCGVAYCTFGLVFSSDGLTVADRSIDLVVLGSFLISVWGVLDVLGVL